MRIITLLVFIALHAAGQQKQTRFKLPQNANGQFTVGTVLAKLKPENKGVDINQALRGRNHVKTTKSFLPEKQQAKLRNRTAPRASISNIDLSLYVEVAYDGSDIETFINGLYSTGLFEVIEPDYTAKLDYTPGDPQRTSQYYLDKIRAYQAWDITKGASDLVIGIVDSGGDLDHPDIASQLFVNNADLVNGVDDDSDGYIDNYRGWDFVGADTLNVNLPNFLGDNNPSNPNGGLGSHGTAVAGCAAAATDNATGISGVGFNTKLLFTKQAADNQGTTKGYVIRGYSGILYAATHGAKIINCSWGGYFYSQIQQDLVTYVTLDLGCLIVAAAGNDNSSASHYPSSYDHVLSVAASTSTDARASFSNFGRYVDITAPGQGIYTTFFNDTYFTVDGTSFSAPIVSGAAALVWAQNPGFSAQQVGEQLRVTADESIYQTSPTSMAKKLGKGRLDVLNALTKQFPSIRAGNPKLINANGTSAEPGEDAFLSFNFTNYLAPSTAGLTVTLTSTSATYATVTLASISPGSINSGATVNNGLAPFKLKLNSVIAQNTTLNFILTYSDGQYSDYQHISFLVNPSFLDVDDNTIITTLASNGRIGYEETASQSNGVGFVYDENSLLYEMGLIMGSSSTASKLFDNVRSTNSSYNQEFSSSQKIKEIVPGERSSAEVFGTFTDNATTKTLSVQYRSLVWKEAPRDHFVILEYVVKNISGQSISNFHLGLFADWDVTDNGGKDLANWDQDNLLGYVRPANADDKPHVGIALLKGIAPQHYAIDNNQNTPGVPFGLYDGFTDAEKITAFSSGIGRTSAGGSTGTGADVSHVVGAGPYNLGVDEEITIAFALVAAPDLSLLQEAARQANITYNFTLSAPRPVANPVDVCFGDAATVDASGASNLRWYKTFTGGDPFSASSSFTTTNLFNDTVFYVSNADESYESVRTSVPVKLKANPKLLTTGSGVICEGNTITLSVSNADRYLWSNGAVTQSIEVGQAGSYSVHVETTSLECESDSEDFIVSVNPIPTAAFDVSGDLISNETVSFINTSTGATQYHWSFGDNKFSTENSPTNKYSTVREYVVTLTATNEFGCSHSASQDIQIITGINEPDMKVQGYPVPTKEKVFIDHSFGQCQWILVDALGKIQTSGESQDSSGKLSIDVSPLALGIYYVTIQSGAKRSTIRIIKEN